MITLKDKIKGAIYGMALGDALGLGTELMTLEDIQYHYPGGLRNFDHFVRDGHRAPYKPGDWTNDTEVILLMLESLLDCQDLSIPDIARRLRIWYDNDPGDPSTPYRMVMQNPKWDENPIVVCHEVWRDKKLYEASNEALNRALVAGIMALDPQSLIAYTQRLVNMTHDDSRCVASTVVAASFIWTMLYFDREPKMDVLLHFVRNIDERVLTYLKAARTQNLTDLNLDDEETSWYTRKTMAAALWTHWNCDSPEEILFKMVDAGGDADTNASLAMMIAGVKYGYDALPDLKHKLHGRERLEDIADRLTSFVEKRIADNPSIHQPQ